MDFVDTSHDAPSLFGDESGLARPLHDNFYGGGRRAPDFGPRQTEYDSPHPDAERLGEAFWGADDGVYAGRWRYRGFWFDVDRAQTERTLRGLVYNGSKNSRSFCTRKCVEEGYKAAAIEESSCYGGSRIGRQAVEVAPTSCMVRCPGDEGQFCGGGTRLSVFVQDVLI